MLQIDLTNELNDDWLKVLPQNDKDLVIELSEPYLALREMGYEKSIEYLIEHDYHFRTDGQRIAILGGAGSGNWAHAGRPGQVGGSVSRTTGMSIKSGPDWEKRQKEAKGESFEYGRPATELNKSAIKHIVANDGTMGDLENSALRASVKDALVTSITERSGVPYDDVNKIVKQWAYSANDDDYRSLSIQKAISEEFGTPLSEFQQKKITHFESVRNDPAFQKLDQEARDAQEQLVHAINTFGRASVEAAEADAARSNVTSRMRQVIHDARERDMFGGEERFWVNPSKYLPVLDDRPATGPRNSEIDTRKVVRAMYNATQERLKKEGISEVTLYRGTKSYVSASTGKEAGTRGTIVQVSHNAASSWSATYEPATRFGNVASMRVPVSRVLSSARTGFGCLNEAEFVVLGSTNDKAWFQDDIPPELLAESVLLGSSKSGNYGHKGRPGQVGGSSASLMHVGTSRDSEAILHNINKAGLITGPVTGGAAYALYTGDFSAVGDIDIMGSPPSEAQTERAKKILGGSYEEGYITHFYRADNGNAMQFEYMAGLTLKGKPIIPPQESVSVHGIPLVPLQYLINSYQVSARPKDMEKLEVLQKLKG